MTALIGTSKICTGCGQDKGLDDFYFIRRSDWEGYSAKCRPCQNERSRKYRAGNRDRAKSWDARYREKLGKDGMRNLALKQAYGITLDDYQRMCEAQGGLCAICGKPPSGKGKNAALHVDHNHETGEVRGLLCSPCNLGIGNLNEDADIMRLAAEYIERFQ